MIGYLLLLTFATSTEQVCNPGPPPIVELLRPSSGKVLPKDRAEVEVDLGLRNAYDIILEFVPTFDSGRYGPDGKPETNGPIRSQFVQRAILKPEKPPYDTRATGTLVLGNDRAPFVHEPEGRYVLVVTFSAGEGDCKETYSDVAGSVVVGPPLNL